MISFQTEGTISSGRTRASNLGAAPADDDAGYDLLTAVRPGDFTFFFYQAPLGVTINWDEDSLRYLPGPGV